MDTLETDLHQKFHRTYTRALVAKKEKDAKEDKKLTHTEELRMHGINYK